MKAAWAVVWRGKNCVTYMTEDGGWSLDPLEARVFKTWVLAKVAAGFAAGVEIVRAWI
jgi:hypothetical protein